MLAAYRVVMDVTVNPLKALMPAQRFQVMVLLSIMWTVLFCASLGAWVWYGELVTAHLLVALGVFLTDFTFKTAKIEKGHRDQPLADGTARYDDVWGA
ncbi:MAG: hypothetical protein AAF530_14120 [Pseudomonadota bacterium]